MVALSLALVAAFISATPLALAQNIPQCVLDCTNQSLAAGGCSSAQDVNCVCTSGAFQAAAGSCIFANCPDQLGAAMELQQQMCSGGGNPTTGGETPTEQQPGSSPTDGGEQPAPSDGAPSDGTPTDGNQQPTDGSGQTQQPPAATTTPVTRTSSRMVTVSTSRTANATSSSPASTQTDTSSTGAGFQTASIASGAAIALFGAIISLY